MHKKTKDYKEAQAASDAMTGGYCKFWDKLCDDGHLVCMVVTCPAAADHNVVAGKEFVLIKKTDERLKSWLWNCCRDTRMGPPVEMLTEKQHAASEAALKMVVVKGQKTRYRFRQECSVRRKLAKSRADELVTMMLPQADGSRGFQKVMSVSSASLKRLEDARKQSSSREILLWMTPSEAPKALQASECSELLDPMRASCWIFAQH